LIHVNSHIPTKVYEHWDLALGNKPASQAS